MKLGTIEIKFLAWTQLRKKRIVRTGELEESLNIGRKSERELLNRLSRKGIILRLRRGLYLIPEKLPPGNRWIPDEYEIISFLMDEMDAQYQIGGVNAFHQYGYLEQIPNSLTIYNDKLTGSTNIGGLSFTFIKVKNARLGGTRTFTTPAGIKISITSLARTLIDAVYDYHRYETLPDAFEWIRLAILNEDKIIRDLISTTLKFGNQCTIQRIGFCLNQLGVSDKYLVPLIKKLSRSKEPICLIPRGVRRGKISKKWRIIANDQPATSPG
jgi:predicted transcriptional regulator of viral defense system